MSADPTSADTEDRLKLCLPMAFDAKANGACGRAVPTSPCSSTSLPSTHAIHYRVSGVPRTGLRRIAPSNFPLRAIADRADS
jgi:hypothetical protein